jgi:transcription-repair coupling factor (superfamily II helicase)
VSERLQLYSRLDRLENEQEISEFIKGLSDRFGALPKEVDELIETVRLRWLAQELGCEKLIIKNTSMKCYLLPSSNETYYQSDVFGNIINFVSRNPARCQLKETKKRLLLMVADIETIVDAYQVLASMKKLNVSGIAQ